MPTKSVSRGDLSVMSVLAFEGKLTAAPSITGQAFVPLYSSVEKSVRSSSIYDLGSIIAARDAFRSDQTLRQPYAEQAQRDAEKKALSQAAEITDDDVLNELVDCGVRANSLEIISIMPLIAVAWANGYIERKERIAVLQAAEEFGIHPHSKSYELLNGWLHVRPEPELFKTWRDYISAIKKFVAKSTFQHLQESTLRRAEAIANAAGGYFGYGAKSAAECAVISELRAAFESA